MPAAFATFFYFSFVCENAIIRKFPLQIWYNRMMGCAKDVAHVYKLGVRKARINFC